MAPAALIAGTVYALSGTADARTSSGTIARSTESQQCGSHAASQPSCNFAVDIQLPLSVSVAAKGSPETGQNATVSWTVSCSVNGGSISTRTGSHTGKTPYSVRLTMPSSESGDCSVNTTTTLQGIGSLAAVLTYSVAEKVMVTVPTGDMNEGAPLAFFMCLRDAKQSHAPGARAVLGSCNSVYMGAWTYNGKTLVHGGLCLTDPHGGGNRTKLLLEKCAGAADQTWTHRVGAGQSDGPFVLKSPHLCLDDPKYTKVINTPLTVYSCNGGPDEAWTLSS
ncbi:MAG TPA: RICIN domain-containing protein [Streptosporangiaceae bacterium]